MKSNIYIIDAFTDTLFGGNPAAVCPLQSWLPDDRLQKIASENNLSETAFFVGEDGKYKLRWFTPAIEIDLCGHATLASAFVIFNYIDKSLDSINFESNSSALKVTKSGDKLTLDFPVRTPERIDLDDRISACLRSEPVELYRDKWDYMGVFEDEAQVRDMSLNFAELKNLDADLNLIVTAPGKQVDFVSRFFAPKLGINEDPVTGSAHCLLVPYWSQRLKKKRLHAMQVSAREGELWLEDRGERILISGKAVLYSQGELSEAILK